MWIHNWLGKGVRKVILSCSLWIIRKKYPSANGSYIPFKRSRENKARKVCGDNWCTFRGLNFRDLLDVGANHQGLPKLCWWHKVKSPYFSKNPFFSEVPHSSPKKRISPYTFSLKISKNVQKRNTTTFRKIISRACFDEYFYGYVLKAYETYLQISLKTIFFKMLWADV